jgi:hypothetical protein
MPVSVNGSCSHASFPVIVTFVRFAVAGADGPSCLVHPTTGAQPMATTDAPCRRGLDTPGRVRFDALPEAEIGAFTSPRKP